MGQALRLAAVMGFLVLFASTSRSDVSTATVVGDEAPTASITEPITGTAAVAPSTEAAVPIKNPFEPYATGPAEEAIPYEALSAEEQRAADRGFDTATSAATHNAFAAAVRERSKRARAEAAQHQLGIDSLDTIGVIQ